ncbi:unnamed protein product [Ilex paraguariensis]|uniref:Nudix hydrolase domain-containing protein n=1 Tax=Ilex paraguariensis TaxID=185542 RepID=A0ABC8UVF2_9AQUA
MTFSSPFVKWNAIGVKVSPQLSSYKDIPPKASYSTTPENAISSVGQERIALKCFLHQINGTDGASSSMCFVETQVLEAVDDEYGGVIINSESLPSNPIVFASKLRSALSHWKRFRYHHAEVGYVMMTYWIPEGPSMLPANASHQVGVGGIVINDKNKSEEIFTGAVREVKEETGIDTEFVEVIAFRHAHNVAFEKSDLFFIYMLRPLSTQIMVDDLEIQAAKWMPLAEFVKQPQIQEDCMFKKIVDICIARQGKRYCTLSVHHLVSKFDGKLSSLYYNTV